MKVLVRTALPSLCVRGAWCGVCCVEGRERWLCPVFEIVMMWFEMRAGLLHLGHGSCAVCQLARKEMLPR